MYATIMERQFVEPNLAARLNRKRLSEANVFTVNVVGGLGCGKTSLINATIDRLTPDVVVGVITCDVTPHPDGDRLARRGEQAVGVNIADRGTPDATDVHAALDWLDLSYIDLLFIENVGTGIGPVTLDLGQDATAAMFSVAGGHDKAGKRTPLVQRAGVVVLSKTDLLLAVPFDLETFRADVRRLNPQAPLCELSALRGEGMETWLAWLKHHVADEQACVSGWFG